MASLLRLGKDGSICCPRSHDPTTEPCLSGYSPENRHFCDGNQKESCHRSVDSIFRTVGSGRDHSPRKTLPGATEITPENLARTCARLASNKKAEDIVVLDLRAISTFTDFFVICSATSEPQLKAIANEIETRLRENHSIRPVAIDGFPASQWIVLDYLQVVVHDPLAGRETVNCHRPNRMILSQSRFNFICDRFKLRLGRDRADHEEIGERRDRAQIQDD